MRINIILFFPFLHHNDAQGSLMNNLLGTNDLKGRHLEIIVGDIINQNEVALKAIKE